MSPVERQPDGATSIDPDEREGLKFPHITTREELNELEQANIQSGLVWLGRSRRKDPTDERWLRTLHRQLFGDVWRWAGEFRRTEKNIGIDPVEIPVQLRILLDDARYWHANDVYPPLEAGARYHHRMVQIHLFPNGNGRHARLATDTYLDVCFDSPPVDWAGGSNLENNSERRRLYIQCLRAADDNDFGPLMNFVGTG